MADGKFLVGKPSGGVTTVTVTDGATNTNLILPESGTVSGVTTAVTDNAIARYDGTTGKLQNSGVIIDDNKTVIITGSSGNVELNSLGGGNSVAFSRNGANYIAANGGTNSAIYFGTGHSGLYHENTKMVLDSSGNLLLTSGTGALGYGAGAGGTVTQLTSKSTAVTLNKPSGAIYTHNAALAAGASVEFVLNNSLVNIETISVLHNYSGIYDIRLGIDTSGQVRFIIKNISASSQSNTITIYFSIIKGAIT